MPRGANPRREREYEELEDEFKDSGRYKGREAEVAARIVNKQRAEYGETKEDRQQDREGTNPDRSLPIDNYRRLKVPQAEQKAAKLSPKQIDEVERCEEKHKSRKGVIAALKKHKKEEKAA